jgi:oligopeptidase B
MSRRKNETILPPQAQEIPFANRYHGEELIDNYHWLRDKNWPKVNAAEVIEHLAAENKYYQSEMQDFKAQEELIYKEIIGRIKAEDTTVPIKKDNYYYYSRTEEKSQYNIYCRKKDTLNSEEEILFDANKLAELSEYFDMGEFAVSPDHKKLVYSYDTSGDERYKAVIKDLESGDFLPESITDILGPIVWHENNQGFYYTKVNDKWRTDQVYYHKLNTDVKDDILVYKETDTKFTLGLYKSSSKRFAFIDSSSKDCNELRFIDLKQDDEINLQLFLNRKNDHLYSVEHHEDSFYILTNDQGKNFRLACALVSNYAHQDWVELIPVSKTEYLIGFDLYQNKLALLSKENGVEKIRLYDYANFAHAKTIEFPEPIYKISVIPTTFADKAVRIRYSSLVTPNTVMEYNFADAQLRALKTQEIPSGYNKSLYNCEYLFVKTKDGASVPVSLVYKKDLFKKDGTNPLYLYGYGSYGYSIASSFDYDIISLLDRGMVYAIAHIRGGDELGYQWYEDGKFLNKKNTFNDFIAAAEFLIKSKYASQDKVVIAGASAGGMLIGACVNERPELFKAAIAHVPFVDVLNTMFDESLPLTPGEFKEWGNPKDKIYYDYIKSYSPYDNIKAQKYPAMYITASLNDPRVTYWEPAKWVAKLRKMKTDDNLLLFETNMGAGHAGLQGRFERVKDVAKEFSFIFRVLDLF